MLIYYFKLTQRDGFPDKEFNKAFSLTFGSENDGSQVVKVD